MYVIVYVHYYIHLFRPVFTIPRNERNPLHIIFCVDRLLLHWREGGAPSPLYTTNVCNREGAQTRICKFYVFYALIVEYCLQVMLHIIYR